MAGDNEISLLREIRDALAGGNSVDSPTATNQEQTNVLLSGLTNSINTIDSVDLESIQIYLNTAAKEVKQDTAIALLTQISEQSATRSGSVQPSQTAIATSEVQEILPLSGTRKRVTIRNHSTTDFILIELNGDASITQGQIVGAGGTWESPGIEEARSQITVVSGTSNDVNISYQYVSTSIFILGEEIILDQQGNLIDFRYPLIIVGSSPVSSIEVSLFEAGVTDPIQVLTFTDNLNPGNLINADFLRINGFDGTVAKEFYVVTKEI